MQHEYRGLSNPPEHRSRHAAQDATTCARVSNAPFSAYFSVVRWLAPHYADVRQNIQDRYADPTANVLALVDAAVRRLNDLHEAEMRRVNEVMTLRADHSAQLAAAEAKRIDAIRAVDVAAVAVASERAAAQATVLANQVSTSAETLRSLVAATATTVAQQLAAALTPITERLASLEKNQYTDQGRSVIANPLSAQAAAQAAERIALLEKDRAGTLGSTKGRTDLLNWTVVLAAALIGLASFALTHLK